MKYYSGIKYAVKNIAIKVFSCHFCGDCWALIVPNKTQPRCIPSEKVVQRDSFVQQRVNHRKRSRKNIVPLWIDSTSAEHRREGKSQASSIYETQYWPWKQEQNPVPWKLKALKAIIEDQLFYHEGPSRTLPYKPFET